jgi:predicted dinucleotide-binding enzyme
MKVTIIGAGSLGRGIGTRAVAAGHDVEILDRDPAETRALADQLGESAIALGPGAPFGGEIVVGWRPRLATRQRKRWLSSSRRGRRS